jgi:hypothetical protein
MILRGLSARLHPPCLNGASDVSTNVGVKATVTKGRFLLSHFSFAISVPIHPFEIHEDERTPVEGF